MAVVNINAPETFAPAYNPIWWLFSSDKTGEPNFEYYIDLSITGVVFAGGSTFIRMKAPADPLYAQGLFDVADILQRQLTSNIDEYVEGFNHCPQSIVEYSIVYGELYGPSSAVTAYIGGTVIGYVAFNGSLSALEWKQYTAGNYVAIDAGTNNNVKLLTNKPASGTVRDGEDQWIYVMSGISGAIKFAHINTYTQGWADKLIVNSYMVINHQYYDPTSPSVERRMLRFASGWNIGEIPAGSVYKTTGGTGQILISPDSITIWEIYFTDSNHNRITESFWVKKDTLCSTHTEYRLHFKNKWGGFDSFTFTKASQINTDITRRMYEKVMGQHQSSIEYTYLENERFKTNFYTGYDQTIRLNSDWISEAQSVWLQELLTCPEIYLDDSTPGLTPVNIIDTKYTQRKHATDKIFNLSIEIQFTFSETRQGA